MRFLAVIANILQVCIVLVIFSRIGLDFGGWVSLGLFLLLLIALLNQVVIFVYSVNKAVHHPLFEFRRPMAKRKDLRVVYSMAPQPTVIIENHPFNVLDVSENGMRFVIAKEQELKKHIQGRISFLSGQSVMFQGNVIRRQKDEATIAFAHPVAQDVLSKEIRMLQGD